MMTTTDTPRVWVGDLSAYNAGKLRGEWVNTTDADAVRELFRRMSHDGTQDIYLGDVEGPRWFRDALGEHPNEDAVIRAGELVEMVEDPRHVADADAFDAWAANNDHRIGEYLAGEIDADELVELFTDAYRGTWDSIADYAYELARDIAPIAAMIEGPVWPFSCIDWEHAGRELEIGGDVWTASDGHGGVYVFDATV